ncbi:MAG: helix-turn-helix domain-containing protein [Bacteroidota bacterium]|nr:helix-turn-helix domain-containing protein [Bacteroidota bacterium]MDP4274498.1 helix-turn-helix domain-containing protein [Bacteroidota bacterium]
MDEKILKKFSNPEQCPVRNVIDRIGDKWSVLVLMVLEDGEVLRFNELCGYIKTISQKMLTVTLKTLEADGLVKRTVYPQIPPKVEYELTPRGQSLMPHLHDLVAWASNNMTDIKKSREIYAAHAESLK